MEEEDNSQKKTPVTPPGSQKESSTPPPKPPRLSQRPVALQLDTIASESLPESTQSPKRKESPIVEAGPSTPSKILKMQNLSLFSGFPKISEGVTPTSDSISTPIPGSGPETISPDDSAMGNIEISQPKRPLSVHLRLASEGDTAAEQRKPSAPERSQSFPQREEEQLEDARPLGRLKHRNDLPTPTETQEMQGPSVPTGESTTVEGVTPTESISLATGGASVGSTLSNLSEISTPSYDESTEAPSADNLASCAENTPTKEQEMRDKHKND